MLVQVVFPRKEIEWTYPKKHEHLLVIILGLTNGTANKQEMNQACWYLKRDCDVSTQRIVGMNIDECVQAHIKALSKTLEQLQSFE